MSATKQVRNYIEFLNTLEYVDEYDIESIRKFEKDERNEILEAVKGRLAFPYGEARQILGIVETDDALQEYLEDESDEKKGIGESDRIVKDEELSEDMSKKAKILANALVGLTYKPDITQQELRDILDNFCYELAGGEYYVEDDKPRFYHSVLAIAMGAIAKDKTLTRAYKFGMIGMMLCKNMIPNSNLASKIFLQKVVFESMRDKSELKLYEDIADSLNKLSSWAEKIVKTNDMIGKYQILQEMSDMLETELRHFMANDLACPLTASILLIESGKISSAINSIDENATENLDAERRNLKMYILRKACEG